jgi:hypothetical protein
VSSSSPPPGVMMLVCAPHDFHALVRPGAPRPPQSTCPECQLTTKERAERAQPVNPARYDDVPGVTRPWKNEEEALGWIDQKRDEFWEEVEHPRGRPLYRRVYLGQENGRELYAVHPIRSPEKRRRFA